jgi:hypothetical protein
MKLFWSVAKVKKIYPSSILTNFKDGWWWISLWCIKNPLDLIYHHKQPRGTKLSFIPQSIHFIIDIIKIIHHLVLLRTIPQVIQTSLHNNQTILAQDYMEVHQVLQLGLGIISIRILCSHRKVWRMKKKFLIFHAGIHTIT